MVSKRNYTRQIYDNWTVWLLIFAGPLDSGINRKHFIIAQVCFLSTRWRFVFLRLVVFWVQGSSSLVPVSVSCVTGSISMVPRSLCWLPGSIFWATLISGFQEAFYG